MMEGMLNQTVLPLSVRKKRRKKRVGVPCSGSRVTHTPETNVSSVPKINCLFNSVKQSIAYQFYILNYEKE